MARRTRNWTPAIVRQRIQTTMLVKRLSDHAAGKCNMTATQVRAAEVLLRKALPDLSNVEMTGKEGAPLVPPVVNVSFPERTGD